MVLLSLLSMMVVWLLLLLLLLPPLYVLLPLLLRSILFSMTSTSVACSIYHPASVISAATVDPVGEGPPLHSDTSSSYPLPGSIFHAPLIPPFAATPTLPFDAAVDTYGK